MNPTTNHAFIGFGNVARAVYQALSHDPSLQFGYITRTPKNAPLRQFNSLNDIVAFADTLWMCVKPQDLTSILQQLRSINLTDKVIVSPVAGKTIAFIESYVGNGSLIVRIMPNLAIAYKKSVTAFTTNQPQNPKTKTIFELLSNLGKTVELTESGFDLFTSVFGSGPAFILSFIKIFKDKMQEFDLPGSLLDELLLQLAQGTVAYFAENQADFSIEQLIANITSKGGTTQAGLDYFNEHHIGTHFERVLEAARDRSIQMGQE